MFDMFDFQRYCVCSSDLVYIPLSSGVVPKNGIAISFLMPIASLSQLCHSGIGTPRDPLCMLFECSTLAPPKETNNSLSGNISFSPWRNFHLWSSTFQAASRWRPTAGRYGSYHLLSGPSAAVGLVIPKEMQLSSLAVHIFALPIQQAILIAIHWHGDII